MPEEQDQSERIRELKDLGFITSLQGAGIEEDRIENLYRTYRTQDDQRANILEATYGAIVGKDEE